MSAFDALGAAAAILQFVGFGIKFGNKVVAIYKDRSELSELQQITREFQRANKAFEQDLRRRSSNPLDPSSGEALLMKVAEDCHTTATELADLLSGVLQKGQDKSKKKALMTALLGEWKKKEIVSKQDRLEVLRQRCHEQLGVVIR
jgi:hypothetical protein